MKNKRYFALLSSLAAAPVFGAPFLAIGDNAELFLTATTGFRYEDNVTLSANNEISDEIFEFTPGFSLEFGKTSLVTGTFAAFERFIAYSDNTSFNDQLANIIFNTSYDGAKLSLDTNASYREFSQSNRDLAGRPAPTVSDELAFGAKGEYAVTEKSKVGLGVQYSDYNYENPFLTDRETYTVPVNYYFAITPKIDLSAGVQYRKTDVAAGFDTEDFYFNFGARGEFTPKLTGTASIGYTVREIDNPASDEEGMIGLKTGLIYALTQKTSLTLDLSNDFETGGNGGGQEVSAGTIGFRTTPAVDIAFRGSIGYQSISYISVDRDDDFIIANLGVTYTYSQQISFDAGYTFMDNGSSGLAAGTEFSANILSLSANIRY